MCKHANDGGCTFRRNIQADESRELLLEWKRRVKKITRPLSRGSSFVATVINAAPRFFFMPRMPLSLSAFISLCFFTISEQGEYNCFFHLSCKEMGSNVVKQVERRLVWNNNANRRLHLYEEAMRTTGTTTDNGDYKQMWNIAKHVAHQRKIVLHGRDIVYMFLLSSPLVPENSVYSLLVICM